MKQKTKSLILTKKQFQQNQKFFIKKILSGKILIFPTDTIYGIGCIATNKSSISKIRKIKKRDQKPFAIFAPSKSWILQNCKVQNKFKSYLKKLPGKYTFIFKLKNEKNFSDRNSYAFSTSTTKQRYEELNSVENIKTIAKKEIIDDSKNLGVRMPNNWFANILADAKIPFVATSVNISGEVHATEISKVSKEIINRVDVIIDDGVLDRSPSKVIDLTGQKAVILRK